MIKEKLKTWYGKRFLLFIIYYFIVYHCSNYYDASNKHLF